MRFNVAVSLRRDDAISSEHNQPNTADSLNAMHCPLVREGELAKQQARSRLITRRDDGYICQRRRAVDRSVVELDLRQLITMVPRIRHIRPGRSPAHQSRATAEVSIAIVLPVNKVLCPRCLSVVFLVVVTI